MNRDYRGLIGLVLAVALGLMLVIGVTGAAWYGRPLTDAGRELIVALGGAIVGALAGFLGGRFINHHR